MTRNTRTAFLADLKTELATEGYEFVSLRNRELRVRCGSYFRDMLTRAIQQARETYNAPRATLRKVAA